MQVALLVVARCEYMERVNMSNPIIRIHNTNTNKIVDREMTETELQEYNLSVAANKAILTEAKKKEEARAALLDKLGITADEAALLLG